MCCIIYLDKRQFQYKKKKNINITVRDRIQMLLLILSELINLYPHWNYQKIMVSWWLTEE